LHGGNFTVYVGFGLDKSKQQNGNDNTLREGTGYCGRIVVDFDESNNVLHYFCIRHARSDVLKQVILPFLKCHAAASSCTPTIQTAASYKVKTFKGLKGT
jgi:hypothetical protein